jgi:hypothetical protein
MEKHRIYTTSVASVYPHYVAKAEKKGRAKEEVDEIIRWLTGYSQTQLDAELEERTDFDTFFARATMILMRCVLPILFLFPMVSSYAQQAGGSALDSIFLRAGQSLAGEIGSFDRKAVYLTDGRIVMYSVIAEIRTRKDSLAAGLKTMFPKCFTAGQNGGWVFRPDTVCIEPQVPQPHRLFGGSSVFLNITSARAGGIEALMHVETGLDSWLFLEIGGAYGRSSSDGPRDIMGTSGVFRSVVDYEAWLIFIGMGAQYSIGAGRVELAGEVGRRSLSSSLASSAGSTTSFAQLSSEVAFITLRYVHGFAASPFMVCAVVRYYIANPAFDSEKQTFAYGVGIGFRF